jgi:hypothetical protein
MEPESPTNTMHHGLISPSSLSTPGSERSEEDGGLTSKTTITTEVISRKTDQEVKTDSFTLTHTGRGVTGQSLLGTDALITH